MVSNKSFTAICNKDGFVGEGLHYTEVRSNDYNEYDCYRGEEYITSFRIGHNGTINELTDTKKETNETTVSE